MEENKQQESDECTKACEEHCKEEENDPWWAPVSVFCLIIFAVIGFIASINWFFSDGSPSSKSESHVTIDTSPAQEEIQDRDIQVNSDTILAIIENLPTKESCRVEKALTNSFNEHHTDRFRFMLRPECSEYLEKNEGYKIP